MTVHDFVSFHEEVVEKLKIFGEVETQVHSKWIVPVPAATKETVMPVIFGAVAV